MESSKIGQGMFALAVALAIGLLTLFFGGVEEKKRNPNQQPESMMNARNMEVILKRNNQGHYVVSGEINHRNAEFLLDTGATDVVVPGAIAERLNLRRGLRSRAVTANGTVTIYQTTIDQLKIGEIQLFNVRASINPAMDPPAVLLGMSALSQVEFLQSGNTLTLRQQTY